MIVVRHETAAEFLARAGAWLEQAEVENNLILGIAGYFASDSSALKPQPYLLTVEDNDKILGASLMARQRQLLITAMPDSAVDALANHLLAALVPVPGVVGANTTAERFATRWTSGSGKSSRLRINQRLHECTAVAPLTYAAGRLRYADSHDQTTLTLWTEQFCVDAHIEDEIPFFRAQLPEKIANGSLFVWEDSDIVSMAGVQRERPNGAAISWVFTPLRLRGRGYATSCVAAVTQRVLDSGKQFCCLYTDLANPTSNRIYRKIG